MTRRRSSRIGGFKITQKGPGVCQGIVWHCDSKNACYGMHGKGDSLRHRWHPSPGTLLRAECVPGGKCQAQVLVGRMMIGRKRGLLTMGDAREWACERAMKG